MKQRTVVVLKRPAPAKAEEFCTILRIYCHVPSWSSQLRSLALSSVSLCAPPPGTSDRHRRRRTSFGRFCASTVTCPRDPVSFVPLRYPLSLSARHHPAQVIGTDDGGRGLDGSAHLLSRAHVIQSASFPCVILSLSLRATPRHKSSAQTTADEFWTVLRIYCYVPSWSSQLRSLALSSVSLCAPPPGTSDRHRRRRTSFGRFCASTVTCCLCSYLKTYLNVTKSELRRQRKQDCLSLKALFLSARCPSLILLHDCLVRLCGSHGEEYLPRIQIRYLTLFLPVYLRNCISVVT
jgi:hypothetical protein